MRINRLIPAGSVSRLVLSGCVAVALAGCSAESTRFGESPFSNPFNRSTRTAARTSDDTVTSVPTQKVQRQALNDITPVRQAPRVAAYGDDPALTTSTIPQRAPVASATTLSTPAVNRMAQPPVVQAPAPVASSGRGGWTPVGGTTIQAVSGDSVDGLARRYGVPASAIAQANGVAANQRFNPGQNVVIPTYSVAGAGTPSPKMASVAPQAEPVRAAAAAPLKAAPVLASAKHHVVNSGETLGGIAVRYRVSRADLARANGLKPTDSVRIGQNLTVPSSAPQQLAATAAPARALAPAKLEAPRLAKSEPAPLAKKLEPVKTVAAKAETLKPAAERLRAEEAKADRTITGSLQPQPQRALDTEKAAPAPAAPQVASSDSPRFRWPVRGRVISRYGQNGSEGVDLAVPEGTAVRAAEDGKVAYAGSDLKNMGNMILIRHSNGYVSVYANNSSLNVKPGDEVRRGQTIAKAGQSGNAANPQVHFEIRKGKTPVDPESLVSE